MKFDRTALIARIDELQAEAKANHEAQFAPRKAAWDKAIKNYREKNAPQLASELRGLANRVRSAKPLTWDDISRAVQPHCFDAVRLPGRKWEVIDTEPELSPFKPDPKLAALRRLLVELKDDQVTMRDLQSLGFEPKMFVSAVV